MRKIPDISSGKPNNHHTAFPRRFEELTVCRGEYFARSRHGMAELPSFAIFLDRRA